MVDHCQLEKSKIAMSWQWTNQHEIWLDSASTYQRTISNNSYAHDKQGVNPGR